MPGSQSRVDALARQQLAAAAVALDRLRPAAAADPLQLGVQLGDQLAGASRASPSATAVIAAGSPRRDRAPACHSTGPATSVWEPSGRPSTSCARAPPPSSLREVDAGLDPHLVQHRDQVLAGDVAGRPGRAPGSRRARRSSTRRSRTPASSAASTLASALAAGVVEVGGAVRPRGSSSRGAARRTRATWTGFAIPVVSPKPTSTAPAAASARGDLEDPRRPATSPS